MNLINRISIVVFMLLTLSVSAMAHYHTLGGIVKSEKNGKPLFGATVTVQNTALGAKTKNDGTFIIKKMHKGEYIITFSYVGYETKKYKVTIEPNDERDLDMGEVVLKESEVLASPIVVTATRSEKVYEDVPVKISVLDNRIFERTASISLKEGLGFQPALRIETNCQNCGYSQIRLNGLEGKYAQILIDGRPVFSALNSVYGLDQLPTNMIDRVEVMRGGGSALYGGNAIAGVVNIITKLPSNNEFSLDVNNSFTDFKTPDRNINFNTSLVSNDQDLGLSIYGNSHSRNAWDANGDGFTELTDLQVKSLGANLFYKPSYLSTIKAGYQSTYHKTRGGNLLALAPHETDITEQISHNTQLYSLQYEQYIGGTSDKFSAYASYQDTKRNSYYGTNKDPNAYGYTDNNTLAAGVQYNHIIDDFLGVHVLTAGYEFNRDYIFDNMTGYKRVVDQTSQTHGVYLQDDWEIGKELDIVLGARVDKNNFIDKAVIIPRANILYKPLKDLSIRGTFSTGYRAPQAFDEDLHIEFVGGTVKMITNSKDLKPEYSNSFSFSADYSFRIADFPMAISGEFFRTQIDDAFALEDRGTNPDGTVISERINASSAKVTGGTIELQAQLSSMFNLKTGYTLQESKYNQAIVWLDADEENGVAEQSSDLILRTPNQYGFFTLNSQITDNFDIDLSGIITGEMYTPHYAGGILPNGEENTKNELVKTPTFFELNAKACYKFSSYPDFELYLGVQNVLNQYQSDFDRGVNRDSGYIYGPGRPRTIYGGIKLRV